MKRVGPAEAGPNRQSSQRGVTTTRWWCTPRYAAVSDPTITRPLRSAEVPLLLLERCFTAQRLQLDCSAGPPRARGAMQASSLSFDCTVFAVMAAPDRCCPWFFHVRLHGELLCCGPASRRRRPGSLSSTSAAPLQRCEEPPRVRVLGALLPAKEGRDGDRSQDTDDQNNDPKLDEGETLLVLATTTSLSKHVNSPTNHRRMRCGCRLGEFGLPLGISSCAHLLENFIESMSWRVKQVWACADLSILQFATTTLGPHATSKVLSLELDHQRIRSAEVGVRMAGSADRE